MENRTLFPKSTATSILYTLASLKRNVIYYNHILSAWFVAVFLSEKGDVGELEGE